MFKKRNFVIFVILIIAFLISAFLYSSNVYAKVLCSKSQVNITNVKQMSSAETLALIDKYQEKYFTIIKRNDMFLNTIDFDKVRKDRKELKKLYKEVTKQITNKEYLKKYQDIQKRYSKCEQETTIGMNEFAQKNYNEVDSLLNEVYKEVKSTISADDFAKLESSEKRWLIEVNNYEKVFNSKDFGTIRPLIYYDFETDMREFRTLLLMLYV